MYRVALPYTTRTTGVDIFDTDNLFRQREIDAQIAMLNQDDGTFLKALDLWSTKEPVSQTLYHWIEDDMLCDQWDNFYEGLRDCWVIYRNPEGSPENKDEYLGAPGYGIYPFSRVE